MNGFVTKLREQVGAIWAGMKPGARIGAIGAIAVFATAIVLLLAFSSGDGGYQVLFSNLRAQDAAEVVATLEEQGVPFRLERNGADIWVPDQHVAPLRLELAALGLPRGGVVGFEAFDTTRLGMTDFERQVQYQRALQGELTRTIRAFEQVQDARVHVALPERSLFIGQQSHPSASVVLELKPSSSMGGSQVQAIVHLLARSVEGLSPENVTVVDTRGNVLTDLLASEDTLRSDAVARQLEIQSAYETRLSRDLQAMLERIYGSGNVVARVSAELNFDRLEEMSEVFAAPGNGRGGLARSEQRTEERYEGNMTSAGGVAGVDSNIPGYVGEDPGSDGLYELVDETINYELNRTVSNRQVASGEVRRLSVAVIIDGQLDNADSQRVSEIAAAVVGVDPSRGDVVSVQSMQFQAMPVLADLAPVTAATSSSPFVYILVALAASIGAIVVMLVVRRRRKPEPTIDLTIDESSETENAVPLSNYEQRKRQMRSRVQTIAKERPKDVVELLRAWMAED